MWYAHYRILKICTWMAASPPSVQNGTPPPHPSLEICFISRVSCLRKSLVSVLLLKPEMSEISDSWATHCFHLYHRVTSFSLYIINPQTMSLSPLPGPRAIISDLGSCSYTLLTPASSPAFPSRPLSTLHLQPESSADPATLLFRVLFSGFL